MSRIVHDGPAVYLNADRSAVVDGDHLDAAFLLVASGGTVHPRLVDVYRKLVGVPVGDPAPDEVVFATANDEPGVESVEVEEQAEVVEPAPTRKPRKRTARKSDD